MERSRRAGVCMMMMNWVKSGLEFTEQAAPEDELSERVCVTFPSGSATRASDEDHQAGKWRRKGQAGLWVEVPEQVLARTPSRGGHGPGQGYFLLNRTRPV
ncbi:hypothetical protein Dimus_019597 [Dionaea muscipula]